MGMRSLLQFLLNLPALLTGRRLDRRLRATGVRRAQLASFLQASGHRGALLPGRDYEAAERRQRRMKNLVRWATAFGAAWVVIESARAVTMF